MAALPNPDEKHIALDELMERVERDDYLNVSSAEVESFLADLEADGDATQAADGWKNTKAGFEVLTGPVSADGGREYGA